MTRQLIISYSLTLAVLTLPRVVTAQEWLEAFRPDPACISRVKVDRTQIASEEAVVVVRAARMSDGALIAGPKFRIVAPDNAPGAWVSATADSVRALEVGGLREGRYIVEAMAIGYGRRGDTVYLAAGTVTSVTLAMNDRDPLLRCTPPRFRRPHQRACVGADHEEVAVYRRLALRYAEPRHDPVEGLGRFDAAEVVLVTDETVCERAGQAYGGPDSPPRRVIVFRLGAAGYIVYDPFEPHRAGEFSLTVIYNSRWQAVAELAG